ncbi:DNA-binding protein [Listeria seeligeri]|uniref:DNA-binding protein n=1 Tax=Listeria seeligeri TaxID=1640 RepID=UPI0010E32FC2|nr:DNA-binding protein [Listeria seeligeri]EAD3476103.1 DNA-binding protein [Listeria monocytogenes]EAF3531152.1 DNA-binding protein [Listeria monocytogenes]EAF8294221.1 DNA-binding protein [Listeria monocytogenes]EAG4637025.1 DNA-binding protein [Listeria monocytogenes]EEO9180107.1 DNA-binding protein [Listeria monocytogenes]
MFLQHDSIIKQKIVADLYEYTMSQKQVADYLDMEPTHVSKLVKESKLEVLFVYNDNSSRKMNIFYKKDVEEYAKLLKSFREFRKKK